MAAILGPWIHSSEELSYAGEAQFTADAALDLDAFHLRLFDRWLKGVDNGVDREPPLWRIQSYCSIQG